jgi:hypothetical protein
VIIDNWLILVARGIWDVPMFAPSRKPHNELSQPLNSRVTKTTRYAWQGYHTRDSQLGAMYSKVVVSLVMTWSNKLICFKGWERFRSVTQKLGKSEQQSRRNQKSRRGIHMLLASFQYIQLTAKNRMFGNSNPPSKLLAAEQLKIETQTLL